MDRKKMLLMMAVLGGVALKAQVKTPNVILIMADDMGYAGLSCFGGTGLQTPNLDRLAANGVMCTDFHTNAPVSSATRASMMTGLFYQRTGLDSIYSEKDPDDGLSAAYTTFPERLQKAGYKTAMFGKWHLGEAQQFNPTGYGFDEFIGFMKGNVDFNSHYSTSKKLDWWHNRQLSYEKGYATTLLNQHTVDFIHDAGDEPFFIYLSHAAIHVPMQGPSDPAVRDSTKYVYRNDTKMPVEEYQRRYREMIKSMDEGVGMIVKELEACGKLESTLIIFLSDNGAEKIATEKYAGANGPFKGVKGTIYEGGIRVPAIFYWKNHLQPSVSDELMMSMDLYPTILDFCHVKYPKKAIDGRSLRDYLLDGREIRRPEMFWAYRGVGAMRLGDWKCMCTDEGTELYNLKDDPSERDDLSLEYPDLTAKMKKDILKWWKSTVKSTKLEQYSIFDLKEPLWKTKSKH